MGGQLLLSVTDNYFQFIQGTKVSAMFYTFLLDNVFLCKKNVSKVLVEIWAFLWGRHTFYFVSS